MAIARRFVIRNASRAKNVATRGVLTRSQSTKIVFDRGSAPDPALELTMLPHSRLGGDTPHHLPSNCRRLWRLRTVCPAIPNRLQLTFSLDAAELTSCFPKHIDFFKFTKMQISRSKEINELMRYCSSAYRVSLGHRAHHLIYFVIHVFRPPGPAAAGRVGLYILLLYFLYFLPILIDENRPIGRPPILYQQ